MLQTRKPGHISTLNAQSAAWTAYRSSSLCKPITPCISARSAFNSSIRMRGCPPRVSRSCATNRSDLKLSEPLCVGRVAHHVPVPIRRTIGPPDCASLAQCVLGRVDTRTCLFQRVGFARTHRTTFVAPRVHELAGQVCPALRSKVWIAAAPQATTNDEVPAVRRNWIPHPPMLHLFQQRSYSRFQSWDRIASGS